MQRLLDRPQGLFTVCGLDQDQAGRIEAERVEAMTMKAAMQLAAVSRHHQNERVVSRQPGQECRDEAEGGRGGALGFGYDFMQGAAGETALRQVGIKRGKAERQGFPQTFDPRQQPAQFVDHDGALTRH